MQNHDEYEPGKFDFLSFLHDNGIRPAEEGDRHYSRDWVNIPCPLCSGNPGNHLGWHPSSGAFTCFRCGVHSATEIVSEMLSVSAKEAFSVVQQYRQIERTKREEHRPTKRPQQVALPLGAGPLNNRHQQYLSKRRFDPGRLQKEWDLKGTGPLGPFKHRIIAPIYHDHRLVSYQGRDITERAKLRYRPCPREQEVRPHKSCLYGLDKVPFDSVLVVEGITDVWRMGHGAVATFGLSFTLAQVKLLNRFSTVYVAFDNGSREREQANKLINTMTELGRQAVAIPIEKGDPADLDQEEADELMREYQLRE